MRASTRISIAYSGMGLALASLTGVLAYLLWIYEPMPETLEELLKPVGLVFLLLVGLTQAGLVFADPLARRVVRMLRHKDL
jgi:hypothetical protein